MKRTLALIASLLISFTVAVAQRVDDQIVNDRNAGFEQELKGVVREMHNTLLRCEKEHLFDFFADEFIGTSYEGFSTNKEQLIKNFRCAPEEAKITRDIEDHKIRISGDSVIVSYRVIERVEISGKLSGGQYLYSDTFVKRDGRWQMISSHATRVPVDRKVGKVEFEIYDDYVGRYASGQTAIFIITREGNTLLGQAPDGEKVELLPENETTFFLKGRDIQVMFERGKSGQVTRMILKRATGDIRLERIY